MKEKMQRRLFIILFLVPTLIAFVLFYVYPLITVFVTTLCKWDYQNLNAPELLPLDDLLANYRYIFTEYPYFKTALVNSLKWALCGALIATPIALITALVTSWKLPGWKWMKNIYIIPNIISAAAIGLALGCGLKPGEMAIGLKIPYVEGQKAVFTKFDRRKEVDLSTVCATVGKFGEDYRVAIGSCAPTPIRLPKTEALLKGKKLTPELIGEAAELAGSEVSPISDVRASAEYRISLVKVAVRRSLAELSV